MTPSADSAVPVCSVEAPKDGTEPGLLDPGQADDPASAVRIEEVALQESRPGESIASETLHRLVGENTGHVLVLGPHAVSWESALRPLMPHAQWTHAIVGDSNPAFSSCDVVLLSDLLARECDPAAILTWLHHATPASARLLLSVPNQAHVAAIRQLLAGEISSQAGGAQLRLGPAAAIGSCFKLLLDCGWLPNMNHEPHSPADASAIPGLLNAAKEAGVPAFPARRNLLAQRPLIDCTKYLPPPTATGAGKPFTVIVPVNDSVQFERNIAQSPGLLEVGAQVIIAKNAPNAAAAYESARRNAHHEWIVFCHQDVYFPAGSGHAVSRLLRTMHDARARDAIIGFAGIGLDATGKIAKCGLLVDRRNRLDFGQESNQAVSIEDFAVAMHRDCRLRIDPTMGWSLWATALCIEALRANADPQPRIVRVPLLHNSQSDYQLTSAFEDGARILRERNPDLKLIPTLRGAIRQMPAAKSPAPCDVHRIADGATVLPVKSPTATKRVFDCVLYNGEIEILQIRLHELDAVVDQFVVVESDTTFSGKPKPVQFDPQHPLIAPFAHKLRHVVVRDMPNTENPWDRETWQRNAVLRGLGEAAEEDLILMSDVDEIPRAAAVAYARDDKQHRVFYFELKLYYFFLNYRNLAGPEANKIWNCAAIRSEAQTIGPQSLRVRIAPDALVLTNAGWHFSYLMDDAGIRKKIAAFSHQELNTDAVLKSIDVRSFVTRGADLYNRPGYVWGLTDGAELPQWVKNNRQQLRDLVYANREQNGDGARGAGAANDSRDNLRSPVPSSKVQINLNGRLLDFHFRGDSVGDKGVLQQIFANQDYKVEFWEQGRTLRSFYERTRRSTRPLIVDAGANIGASAVWFLNAFPDSFVFCIEPDRNNFELLERNTRGYREKFNFCGAVAGTDGKVRLIDPGLSDWGFRTVAAETDALTSGGTEVEVITPQGILSHPAVAGTQPLLFKIDIEGGEENLFRGDTSWMRQFPLVIIELHDWMLPFSGNSTNFLRAAAQYDFDIVHRGENIFLFNREILSP